MPEKAGGCRSRGNVAYGEGCRPWMEVQERSRTEIIENVEKVPKIVIIIII